VGNNVVAFRWDVTLRSVMSVAIDAVDAIDGVGGGERCGMKSLLVR
jgi:hypothetical protein